MTDAREDPQRDPHPPASAATPLEWYRTSAGTNSPTEKEFMKLPPVAQAELMSIIRRHAYGEPRRGEVKSLGRGLWEFRAKIGSNIFRAVFAKLDHLTLVLHVMQKKQDKTPTATARTRLRQWRTWNS